MRERERERERFYNSIVGGREILTLNDFVRNSKKYHWLHINVSAKKFNGFSLTTQNFPSSNIRIFFYSE